MALVRHQPFYSRLLIGACLTALTVTSWCEAQYSTDNGLGNTPMAPPTDASSSSNIVNRTVPLPPVQQTNPSVPGSWPSGAPATSPWSPSGAVMALPPVDQLTLCDNARIIGHVGEEVILAGDVAAVVNEILEANKDRISPDELEATREFLVKKMLKTVIQYKLVYLDAKRAIPADNWPGVEKQLEKMFDENELDKMMKRTKTASRNELDAKLQRMGTSVDRERKAFCERALAEEWKRKQIKRDEEITYDQMMFYYRRHQDEFTTPARAKWDELMVRFANYPNKAAAYEAIARLGNRVAGGVAFDAVAREASDGATANKGGEWDWTTRGSLVCKQIDRELFSLPVGQLSSIIEGPTGFHIVRVTDRTDVKVEPFLDAQVDIREKIIKERSEKQLREYLAKLEAKTPVSTIFDREANSQKQQQITRRPQMPLR